MFSPKVEAALAFASLRHAGQTRKAGEIPYFTHLVHVALILARLGADDETLTIALLHDVIEDTTHDPTERATVERHIRETWGERVMSAVLSLTEPKRDDQGRRLSWQARKEAYIEQLERAEHPALLVSAADKVHNLETLLESLAVEGEEVWDRFRGGPEETLWFYGAVLRVLRRRLGLEAPLVRALATAAARLEAWVQAGGSG